MKLTNAIFAGLMIGMTHGMSVKAEPTKGYFTMDAMGCMLLKECTDGVDKIYSSGDLRAEFPNSDWGPVSAEFDKIMLAFEQIGVDVHLADSKYFPVGHRGVYHTVSNHFYLNRAFVHRPHVLMSVVRHEGWHAAQDCMAGTIKNNMIAIIKNEEDVPEMWAEMARRAYALMPHAIPWEKEATWAGKTEGMTQEALESCARGTMWTDYDPTPMTREWLVKNGYLNK
jgi:hypothetical protein|tara:strand:- start:25 stop:702 length:678 start_codon:yes stop_codon:yes gene_type:complete